MSRARSYTCGGSEAAPVIIELGSRLLKCGFAGEGAPRHVVLRDIPRFSTPALDLEEWIEVILDRLDEVFYTLLLVDPRDQRVVLCEELLAPKAMRDALAWALFEHYEAPSVLFAPAQAMALLPTGGSTGLVVDLGAEEVRVLPVFGGAPLLGALRCAPIGARVLRAALWAALVLAEGGGGWASEAAQPPAAVLEEVIAKVGLCALSSGGGGGVAAADAHFGDALGMRAVPGGSRCAAAEAMFSGSVVSESAAEASSEPAPPAQPVDIFAMADSEVVLPRAGASGAVQPFLDAHPELEGAGVVDLVEEALLACPLDLRAQMVSNILVVGGHAMIPGVRSRLLRDLRVRLRVAGADGEPDAAAGSEDAVAKPSRSEQLKAVFAKIDIHGSGSLDREELGEAFELMGWAVLSGDVDKIFLEVDDDNSGEIDVTEFTLWLNASSGRALTQKLAELNAADKMELGGLKGLEKSVMLCPDSEFALNMLAWTGGSIAGRVVGHMDKLSVKRMDYLDGKRIPDWLFPGSSGWAWKGQATHREDYERTESGWQTVCNPVTTAPADRPVPAAPATGTRRGLVAAPITPLDATPSAVLHAGALRSEGWQEFAPEVSEALERAAASDSHDPVAIEDGTVDLAQRVAVVGKGEAEITRDIRRL